MIKNVGTVSVFVEDQDRAKAFYTEKLGLELRSDTPLYPGATARWLSVAPAGAQTEINLYLMDENWQHYQGIMGKSQSITLNVDDIAASHQEMAARGVNFVVEPKQEFWGTYAMIEDSEGNHLMLVEVAQA